WRADRPQKGRYREFYQCDADIVGSNSLLNETELALIYHEVFVKLGIRNYELKINSRKILTALAELCGGAEKMIDITIAIDKLDKIGLDKVKAELTQRGRNDEKLQQITALLGHIETGKRGIEELEYVVKHAPLTTHHSPLTLDFTLA